MAIPGSCVNIQALEATRTAAEPRRYTAWTYRKIGSKMSLIDSLLEAISYNIGSSEAPEAKHLSVAAQIAAFMTFPLSWLALVLVSIKWLPPQWGWRFLFVVIAFFIAWQISRFIGRLLIRSDWKWTKK